MIICPTQDHNAQDDVVTKLLEDPVVQECCRDLDQKGVKYEIIPIHNSMKNQKQT